MGLEVHTRSSRTEVREGTLARHHVVAFDGRGEDAKVLAIVSGLGRPRTWSMACDAALRGFGQALAEHHKLSAKARIAVALEGARTSLATLCNALVERLIPDATILAFAVEAGELEVISAGGGRVYLYRENTPQRLTPRNEPQGGIMRLRPTACASPLRPGDLILAGTATAFSMSSIATAVTALSRDPSTPPRVITEHLLDPATQAGVGAAAAVLRL